MGSRAAGPAGEHRLRCWPNPVDGVAMVRFALARPGEVRLRLFDIAGRETARLLDGERLEPGEHVVRLDALHLPSGVYHCRLESGGRTESRKVVVAR